VASFILNVFDLQKEKELFCSAPKVKLVAYIQEIECAFVSGRVAKDKIDIMAMNNLI
jgi:hypothetical protein